MDILINGCSFSRGPNSWPYYLDQYLDAQIYNLAQAGSGNTYIRQSTISELSIRRYNLVIILWTGPERIDVQVEDIDFFDTPYTSKYQSMQNDWPEKIVYPINDQDYVQKNWVFGTGYINRDPFLLKNELFQGLYRHVGFEQHQQRSLIDMICLQDFLKSRNMPYAFGFHQNYYHQLRTHTELWTMLDEKNLIDSDLGSFCDAYNSFHEDGMHPGIEAHRQWARHVANHLQQRD